MDDSTPFCNPENLVAISARRRAKVRQVGGNHTKSDILDLFVLQRGKCAICKCSIKSGYHVDHIMPLKLGGHNSRSNLQLLCASCNVRKSCKHPIDFARSVGMLL
jgi:5-methylcytosine-specific restriction endonuclease McrA